VHSPFSSLTHRSRWRHSEIEYSLELPVLLPRQGRDYEHCLATIPCLTLAAYPLRRSSMGRYERSGRSAASLAIVYMNNMLMLPDPIPATLSWVRDNQPTNHSCPDTLRMPECFHCLGFEEDRKADNTE